MSLIKLNQKNKNNSYEFDLSADAYYPADILVDNEIDTNDIYTISVFLELDADDADDIVCENDCEKISAPFFWLHEYYGLHSCLSHLPASTQTEILNQIKNL